MLGTGVELTGADLAGEGMTELHVASWPDAALLSDGESGIV
jgi:hypothetical protein